HYGWGKLIIDSTCTAGTVIHGAHVELLDENGDPYSGNVSTELVSEPGGVAVFTGSALSDVNAIKSLVSDVDSQLTATDAALSNTLSSIYDLISDVDSQLTASHSLISDIESQIDAGVGLSASALSDIHSATLGRSLAEPTSEPSFSDT